MPTKTEEYLEATFKDAFKRELEVDENVARTLPFFAATLALAATLYSFIIGDMVPLAWTPLSLLLHGLLSLAAALLVWVLWQLFSAVRQREYRIPPKETELIVWADELRTYFEEQGLKPTIVDTRTVEELRRKLIAEYAEAAEHNRTANKPKLGARAKGFTALVGLLVVAFSMIGIMFMVQRVGPDPKDRDHDQAHSPTSRPRSAEADAAAFAGDAARAEVASRAGGGEISGSPGRQHGEPVTASNQSQAAKPQSGTSQQSSPAAPAPKPLPQAPTHQLLKKSEDGGGPLIKGQSQRPSGPK